MRYSMIRCAIVSHYGPFARERGLDPQAMLRAAGLPARCLTQPDLRVRVGRVHRLLEASATRSGSPDFGLQLSRTRRLAGLGALGALMRDERTVRHAIRRSIDSAHLNGTAMWMSLNESDGYALVRLMLDADGELVIRQGTEMAIGGLFSVLQELLGAGWAPVEVRFAHAPAASPASHRRVFGCPVRFGAEFNGIALRSSDLDRPVPLSDAALRRYAILAAAAAPMRGVPDTLHAAKQQMMALVANGRCTCTAVAASLGMDRRTLHRRLRAHGSNYSRVYDEVRLEIATQLLKADRADVTQIAELAGFQSLSAFSRWFKRASGAAPSAWRATARPGARGSSRHSSSARGAPLGASTPRRAGG